MNLIGFREMSQRGELKLYFFQINYVNLHSFYGARQGKLTTSQQGADTVRSRLNITYHGLIKCFI